MAHWRVARACRSVRRAIGRVGGSLRWPPGWFHRNDDARTPIKPHIPPTAAADAQAAWLQGRFGPVPLTLLSWVRIVGDVWRVGTHPDWTTSVSADPLLTQLAGSHHANVSIRQHFDEDAPGWQEWLEADPDLGPFVLAVAPDRLHKGNVSGGAPYGFRLPDGCADGLFVAATTMPFVSCLMNWVFRRGGFPAPTGAPNEWRSTGALAKDLLPLSCGRARQCVISPSGWSALR